MKKSKLKNKPLCKSVNIGIGLKFEICNDTITNTDSVFLSMDDCYKQFIGSVVSKKDLKKLAKLINKFLD
jgi:hypothetical protein